MKEGVCKNGVPFLIINIYPIGVEHVFVEEGPVPEAE